MAQWGTPEYNRQQQAMWDQQAAVARQQQDQANRQIRERNAADQARAAANRTHLDTMAGMTGAKAPMYGGYSAFEAGRHMTGRDNNGDFYIKPTVHAPSDRQNAYQKVSTSSSTNSGGGSGVFIFLILLLGIFVFAINA